MLGSDFLQHRTRLALTGRGWILRHVRLADRSDGGSHVQQMQGGAVMDGDLLGESEG